MLVLENDAVSSAYDMAGDDKERVVYDVGIQYKVFIRGMSTPARAHIPIPPRQCLNQIGHMYTWSGLSERQRW
jgi:hypothetical protein